MLHCKQETSREWWDKKLSSGRPIDAFRKPSAAPKSKNTSRSDSGRRRSRVGSMSFIARLYELIVSGRFSQAAAKEVRTGSACNRLGELVRSSVDFGLADIGQFRIVIGEYHKHSGQFVNLVPMKSISLLLIGEANAIDRSELKSKVVLALGIVGKNKVGGFQLKVDQPRCLLPVSSQTMVAFIEGLSAVPRAAG